jgi:acyl-CoA reductase-like NAD-dependent aldehyde dehydrogenase
MVQQTISPVDGRVYVQRELASPTQIDRALDQARKAHMAWRLTVIEERAHILRKFCDAFASMRSEIAAELTWQMGRPLCYTPKEVDATLERARYMIDIAPEALADIDPGGKTNFRRFIRREPLGVVFSVAAWNYPYLIAVNSVIPALMAGNAVILKHSAQTPLCAERFAKAFEEADLPAHLFQVLHLDHQDTERVIRDPRVDFIAFTGSVSGGHAVHKAAAERFVGTGMELGGCDPVYVRQDANLNHAIESIVDGAYFNSGQSCCGLQRIYVHESLYSTFVEGFVAITRAYRLGNPVDPQTTLGPVVRTAAARIIREQVARCTAAGARGAIDEKEFPDSRPDTPYLAPQVLLDVDHSMPVMREEIFGPVAGIMRVQSDEEAIRLMNDSNFGLTAAIWTADEEAAIAIGNQVQTGTWFMNRCDYLDPALAWVGVKDSGRGCTLSKVGYEALTRPKSYHLRLAL